MAVSQRNLQSSGQITDRVLNAEKCLLGSCVIDSGALAIAAQTVEPDMFYSAQHRIIYEALLALMQAGRPIDIAILTDYLGSRLNEIGGIGTIVEIFSLVPTSAHVQEYAEIVRRNAGIRGVYKAGLQIQQLAMDAAEEGSDEELYAKAQERLLEITSKQVRRKRVYALGELLPERWGSYEAGVTERSKVRTGFADLDASLGGLGCGDVIVIAARPGMGKTALALGIARNVADKHKVLFFSLEMSRDQIVDRLVAAEAQIDLWKLRNKRLNEDDWRRGAQALAKLPKDNFFIDDTSNITTGEMMAKSMALKVERGLDLVVIDYLGLVGDKAGPGRSRNDEVSLAVRNIKAMAKTLNIPVVLLSQLSREVERDSDKKPQLFHLRDSGEVEQTADVVIFIYRPAYYDPETKEGNIAEIIIAKQKNGPTGTMTLAFLEEYAKFVPLERRITGASETRAKVSGD